MNTLINGMPCDTISVYDRGLLYGDGVFRTLLLRHGKLQQWQRHYSKLLGDCSVIDLSCPSELVLHEELLHLCRHAQDGVVKVIITRGSSQRGYAPSNAPSTTRILNLTPLPTFPESFSSTGVRVNLCRLRLGFQPHLAGVKHLNRLDNVLAASEWDNPDVAEGLLLDESGSVIEGIRSNIFMVKKGELSTPDLSRCGVAGVQRERVIDWARVHNISCKIEKITLDNLLDSDEVFLVNSVIGLWPVREFSDYYREHHPIAHVIQDWLRHESN